MLKGISASMMPRQSVHVFTKKYGFTIGIEAVISTISFSNVQFLGCLQKCIPSAVRFESPLNEWTMLSRSEFLQFSNCLLIRNSRLNKLN